MREVIPVRNTSASSRNVAVSDQSSAEAVMVRPPLANPLESIRVKAQGPAMQEALALRNSFSGPESNVTEPEDAFQFPSGEQGAWALHGTFPLLTTWNVCAALPTFSSVCE